MNANFRNILMTGVTGAIGSMHVLELLARGYQIICLVRGQTEDERFSRLASIIGLDAASRVMIINGDVTQPLAGLDSNTVESLRGQIDVIIHHAGSIKFDGKYRNEIIAANVGGTANMLALAQALAVSHFVYDSTAYVLNPEPRNPYEESKKAAEAMVLDWQYGKAMVLRPSIVIGREADGMTNGFSGYFGFFSGFYALKQSLKGRWANQGREACLKQGFEFDETGTLILHQPLFIDYSRDSTLNLVTVDWAVESMTDLMETAKWGTAYNVVNNNPPKVAWVIERSLAILGIQGVERLSESKAILPSSDRWKSIQQSINSALDRFWPYINRETLFASDAPKPAPLVDQALLQKMLGYAVARNFGRKKRD